MIRRTITTCVFAAVLVSAVAVSFAARPPKDLEQAWKRYMALEAMEPPLLRYPFASCFRSAAKRYGLPETLLLALARGESFFDPRAVSDRNCHGLMQIQWPGTAKDLGVTRLSDLYDPCTNIRAGAAYLRKMLDRYDQNLHLALAAYNYGPGRIRKHSPPQAVPKGARWYSGYIYRHLRAILSGRRGGAMKKTWGERKCEIIAFSQPFRAVSFLAYVEDRAPALSLEWFRTGLNRYQVVMLYRNEHELAEGRAALEKLGLRSDSL